jgi:hypothetical protein
MPELNTGFPHSARVWNYWLSGVVQAASKTLDFSQPVALMMLGILNHIVDDDEAHGIVDRLVDAVPSGSYLVVGHPAKEFHGEAMAEAMRLWNERGEPRSSTAAARSWPASSTAWSCWSPAWCPARAGGRTPPTPPRCRSSARSGESPDQCPRVRRLPRCSCKAC